MPEHYSKKAITLHISVFLILCAFFLFFSIKALSFRQSSELTALDWLRPVSYKYFCPQTDLRYLKIYETYFSRIEKYLGGSYPEVYGLLGYCAYQRGDLPQAVRWYQKALDHNPRFFWYYYNLGLIDFQAHKYDEGLSLFKTGLNLDLKDSFITIFSSQKIYMPLVSEYMPLPTQGVADQLKGGWQTMERLAFLIKSVNGQVIDDSQLPPLVCY